MPSSPKICLGAMMALSGGALGFAALGQTSGTTPAASVAFFETKVRPILKANCLSCHGESASGGLRLTSRAALLKGGNSGPAVSLQKPDDSLLLHAINYQGRQMPPGGKLPQAQIDLLTQWVHKGLPWT